MLLALMQTHIAAALLAFTPPHATSLSDTLPPWHDPSPHCEIHIPVANAVQLEVLDWGGRGKPLVFLAGGGEAAHDLAGRVADLRAVLDSLGLERVAVVGHSIAGDELTAFAGAYPTRVTSLVYLDAAYDHSNLRQLLGQIPAAPPMQARDSASSRAVQAYLQRVYGMHIPEAQLRAIGRYDSAGHLVADVTPSTIDSLILAGCGHPHYAAVRAPALVIDAVVDSVSQVFPYYAALDAAHQEAARRFTAALVRWGAAERARVRRELATAELLELHGANHYVFDSHRTEVTRSMREFLAMHRNSAEFPPRSLTVSP
jgi:non-heme chloroperoxidase